MNMTKLALMALAATATIGNAADAEPKALQPDLHPYEHTYTRLPPATVPAGNIVELLSGHVLVGQDGEEKFNQYHRNPNVPLNAVEIFVFRPGGSFVRCRPRNNDVYKVLANHYWPAILRKRLRNADIPVVATNSRLGEQNGAEFSTTAYDGTNGTIVQFMHSRKRTHWWPITAGHLQERIPAAVYQLCPDFPPAAEIGFEVNEAQTAVTYPELLAQDPGRRILRPDLVVENAIEPIRKRSARKE